MSAPPELALSVREHRYRVWANPHMVCTVCRLMVAQWHDVDGCPCGIGTWNEPCSHHAGAVTACPTWRDEDHGCTCANPGPDHRDHLMSRSWPLWAYWPTAEHAGVS